MSADTAVPARSGLRPLVPVGRAVGVDVARCVALVAMMATHVLVAFDEGGVTFAHQLAGGRASALFAVLAGVSIALVSGRTNVLRGRQRVGFSVGLMVRAVLVGVLGLVLGELPTNIAIILTYYGVLFVCAIPFVGLRPASLVAWCAGWVVVVPVLSQLLRPQLPKPSGDSPSFGALTDPWQLLTELTWTGYYPAVPWVAYLLAGMAVGRCDLTRTRTAGLLVAVGAVLAGLAKGLSALLLDRPGAVDALLRSTQLQATPERLADMLEGGLYGATRTDTWWWLAVSAPHSTTPFDLAHTIGTSLLVLGLCVLVAGPAPRTLAVLFGAGTMTLTLYSLHVVLRTPEFLPGETSQTYLAHVAIVVVAGALYRLARIRGPLERLVALLSGLASRRVTATGGRVQPRPSPPGAEGLD